MASWVAFGAAGGVLGGVGCVMGAGAAVPAKLTAAAPLLGLDGFDRVETIVVRGQTSLPVGSRIVGRQAVSTRYPGAVQGCQSPVAVIGDR